MALIIAAGESGTTWTNDTGKAAWQFICELRRSCGQCVQYHMQIGKYWPLPFHRNCSCRQTLIVPGETSHPFVDFREIIRDASPDQRRRFVGSTNLRLIESGIVAWDDVVSAGRIRTLAEVVERCKLKVKDIEAAGVSKARARLAHKSAHPEIVETARRSAATLAETLVAQGVPAAEVYAATGQVVAERVRLGGPSGPIRVAPRPIRISPTLPAVIYLRGLGGDDGASGAPVPAIPPPVTFGPSRAAVEPTHQTSAEVESGLSSILGREASLSTAADLVGAPAGARVEVSIGRDGDRAFINIYHDDYGASREIRRMPDGSVVIYNNSIKLDPSVQAHGIGTEIIGRQVENAGKLGVSTIHAEAARDDSHNGYYTWPRLGFDADIPAGIANKLPAELSGSKRISDLMGTESGRAWWKEHGESVSMTFDPREGSASRKTLDAYLAEKAALKKAKP